MAFWDKITSQGEIEDRRSAGPLFIVGGGGLGLGGLILYLALTYFSGGNVGDVINSLPSNVQINQAARLGSEDF